MTLTNDQYFGLSEIVKWYSKYKRQFFEISGTIGTGVFELLQAFIEQEQFEIKDVMYLSFDQKLVHELAIKGLHSYYIYPAIYKHERYTNWDTIPILNPESKRMEVEWKKKLRNKLPREYRLIVITDALLLNESLIRDISSFGIPVIMLTDRMLLPSSDSLIYLREPDVELFNITERGNRDPIVYFANKIKGRKNISYGAFNSVTVVPKKQMSVYNLKYPDMILTVTDELRNELNLLYRDKVLGIQDSRIVLGEKVISHTTLWNERITNKDNSKIKVYLTNGLIGTLTKVNKHALVTKFINVDFKPEFYHESFISLDMDRYYPNRMSGTTRQEIPDDEILFEYAYALSIPQGRYSYWNKVSLIIEDNSLYSDEMYQRLLYTGISRAKESLTIII